MLEKEEELALFGKQRTSPSGVRPLSRKKDAVGSRSGFESAFTNAAKCDPGNYGGIQDAHDTSQASLHNEATFGYEGERASEDDVIIRAENIVKSFGNNIAVDGLSLSIKRGEVYGFLGPNGAGKTTTVNILTTADLPDSAKLIIDGVDALSDRVTARSDIGIVQQQNSLEKEISVRENIVHHGLMQNMSRKQINDRMDVLCKRMQLTNRLDSLVRDLSGGWKKRVAIVCSLIHSPKILFLDEPATGLDTQSRNLLYSMVKSINAEGTTIFFTTHYIYEAEDLCDRIGVINEGKLVAEGTPQELQSKVPPTALSVVFEDGREEVSYFESHEEAQQAALKLDGVASVSVRQSNLEDVFLELTGRSL